MYGNEEVTFSSLSIPTKRTETDSDTILRAQSNSTTSQDAVIVHQTRYNHHRTTTDTSGQVFALIFFSVLLLFGIDSAFSIAGALTIVVTEKTACSIRILAGVYSTFYCGGGYYRLDIADRYINNYGMILLGVWFYALERQAAKYFMSLLFSLQVALFNNVDGLFVFIALIGLECCYFDRKKIVIPDGCIYTLTPKEELSHIMEWKDTAELRNFMNDNVPTLGDNWQTSKQTKDSERKALICCISLTCDFQLNILFFMVDHCGDSWCTFCILKQWSINLCKIINGTIVDIFFLLIGLIQDSQRMDTIENTKNCNVLFAVFCFVLCRVAVHFHVCACCVF